MSEYIELGDGDKEEKDNFENWNSHSQNLQWPVQHWRYDTHHDNPVWIQVWSLKGKIIVHLPTNILFLISTNTSVDIQ